MQYILTQEQLNNLVPRKEVEDRDIALEIARKRILKHSGFTCIHDSQDEYALCDGCPCLATKDELQEAGSNHEIYKLHSLICNLRKEFSQ